MHLENRRLPFIPCSGSNTGVVDSMFFACPLLKLCTARPEHTRSKVSAGIGPEASF